MAQSRDWNCDPLHITSSSNIAYHITPHHPTLHFTTPNVDSIPVMHHLMLIQVQIYSVHHSIASFSIIIIKPLF